MQNNSKDTATDETVAPGAKVPAIDKANNSDALAAYFVDEATGNTREVPFIAKKDSIGHIRTFKSFDNLCQWALPVDFSIWRRFGPHMIEVLSDLPDGQPEIPPAGKRGFIIVVVREGHEKEDRNAAWDSYEADPSYGETFVPFRWLGQWARLAAVTRAEGIREITT